MLSFLEVLFIYLRALNNSEGAYDSIGVGRELEFGFRELAQIDELKQFLRSQVFKSITGPT